MVFVEERVNSGNVTTMSDIPLNFGMTLEDALVKLGNNLDESKRDVDEILNKLTTAATFKTTMNPVVTSEELTMPTSNFNEITTESKLETSSPVIVTTTYSNDWVSS